MFGLLSGRISDGGLTDRSGSWANPDAAALKSMKAKKQSAAQARLIFMDSNVKLGPAKCRSVLGYDLAGKMPAGPTARMAVPHRRHQVCAFPHGEVRQCLVRG